MPIMGVWLKRIWLFPKRLRDHALGRPGSWSPTRPVPLASHTAAHRLAGLHTRLGTRAAAARSRPAAAVEGPTRRGAWPWKVLGIRTRVTAAVGCLTTAR